MKGCVIYLDLDNIKTKKAYIPWKIYESLFHITLGITFFYMSYPQLVDKLFIVNKGYMILYVLLFLSGLLTIIFEKKRRALIGSYLQYVKKSILIIITISAYFLWDFMNFLYAHNSSYFFDKYSFILKMIFLSVNVFLYVLFSSESTKTTPIQRLKLVFLNMGIVAILLSILSEVMYYIGIFTKQDNRVAPTADYNNYALTILIGYISLIYITFFSDLKISHKRILLFFISGVCIPPIYLSASRRGIYLLLFFLIIFIIMGIVLIIKEKYYKNCKEVGKNILVFVACIIMVVLQINAFYAYNESKTITGITTNERIAEDVETNVVGARSYIWKYAISNIREFDLKEMCIGGGGSYSNDIYSEKPIQNKELAILYRGAEKQFEMLDPHNFILNDMLEGGIIKIGIIFIMAGIIIAILVKGLKKDLCLFFLITSIFIILVMSLLVSAHFGLMWGRWTIFILTCVVCFDGCDA